ncbi:MAG: hypothetical protein ACK5V3_13715 [Bdellovibrionales bacterium]
MISILSIMAGAQPATPDPDAPPPTPTITPEEAAVQGEAAAAQLANGMSSSSNTQNTNQDSLYTASVDNMINTRQAQTTAAIISNDLGVAATSTMSSCSSGPEALSDPDCYMSSALVGMQGLTNESATSFGTAGDVSWSNVCQYSSISCNEIPPNPFESLLPPNPVNPTEVVEDLEERGFTVNLQTGVVRIRGGKVMFTSQEKSLQKFLGNEATKKLLEKIKGMERSALKRLSEISRQKALQALGLTPQIGAPKLNPLAADFRKSDSALSSNRSLGYREIANTRPYDDGSEIGMVTSYRGEPVGVSNDSLFRMVKYRYQVKKSEKSFMAP